MSFYNAVYGLYGLLRTAVDYLWSLIDHDHFPPHPSAGFEGYYTRVQLDDGGSLVLIFCWVKDATKRKNLVHVSYHPVLQECGNDQRPASFNDEFYPDVIHVSSPLGGGDSRHIGLFVLEAEGIGSMKVGPDTAEYAIACPDQQLEISVRLTNRTSWSVAHNLSSPMGIFIYLSSFLPLNWHVHSTGSDALYSISYKGVTRRGSGLAHMEKNWGSSFPRGWLWTQSFGRSGERFCMAGGAAIPGVHAYLVGYRSSKCEWDFRPPITFSIGRFSPFMTVEHDSRAGVVQFVARTPFKMLVARVEAPIDTFMGLACPLQDGHKPDFAFESFSGRTWVEAWQRRWPWEEWQCVEKTALGIAPEGTPCSVLEFGGEFHHLVGHSEREKAL